MKTKKVFLSHPMHGLSDEKVKELRGRMARFYLSKVEAGVIPVFIDNYAKEFFDRTVMTYLRTDETGLAFGEYGRGGAFEVTGDGVTAIRHGGNMRLLYLGSSIVQLANADVIVFSKEYQHLKQAYKGCQVEEMVADLYGIEKVYEE